MSTVARPRREAACSLVPSDRKHAQPHLLRVGEECRRLVPRAHAELREGRREMALDGAFGEEELARDAGVGETHYHQSEDLLLPERQRGLGAGGHLTRQYDLAAVDGEQRAD